MCLLKNDFDEFLKDHLQFAILFSKLLAERIKIANKQYVHQIGWEEQSKRLLSHEEEQQPSILRPVT